MLRKSSMLKKKIINFFKIFKDYVIGAYIKSKNREDKFRLIYKFSYWKSGYSESFSGAGSELNATQNIRKSLEKFIYNEKIKSILDIPCGDFNWMSNLNLKKINYTGADIVPDIISTNKKSNNSENINFLKLDLIQDNLNEHDLIFNRDCLVHFNDTDIFSALENIKKSKCKFFASTIFLENFNNSQSNLPDNWRPINLCETPFNLPKPYSLLDDEYEGKFDKYKKIAIWKIENL